MGYKTHILRRDFLRKNNYDSFTTVEAGRKNVGIFEPHNIRGKFAEYNPEEAMNPDFMKADGGAVDGYAPGDIATLTVTFKDSLGNLANDSANTIAQTNFVPVIAASNLTAVTSPSASDATAFGVKKYTFTVGNTSGNYASSIDFPYVDNVNSSQKAITAQYAISSSDASLNDVLKGIVSLIASINKQIAALAKLVTKKK